jgi:hypothetical protein
MRIFSTQGRAPCCFFYKYYAELAKTFFFCLTLGQTGSGVLSDPWSLCLSHHLIVGHICLIFLDKNMYTEKHLIALFNDHDYI